MPTKKPRAKTINKNWAAIDAVGWHWTLFTWPNGRFDCLFCNPKHCASIYAYPEFVESMNADMLAEHHDPALKYARKWRRHDLAMAWCIRAGTEAHSAIAAAAIAATTPAAKSKHTRTESRL